VPAGHDADGAHDETTPTWSAMVARWHERTGVAVASGAQRWSGPQLLGAAARAARDLVDLDASFELALPALIESSAASFARIIGGAAAGRPLAPLTPRMTPDELRRSLLGLGSSVLLTDRAWVGVAEAATAGTTIEVHVLDELDEPTASGSSDLGMDATPDAVAFVLHTSGTTGAPKPVRYTQAALARRVQLVASLSDLDHTATYATMSSLHHVAGLGNHAVALASGATTIPVARFGFEAWAELGALGATHVLCVPAALDLLLEADVLAFPTLRVLQYGGSPIHPDTLRSVLAELPGVDLVNLFGQTEGSPITCLTPEDHRRIVRDGRHDLLASVGRPVPGVEVRIEAPDECGVGEVVARARHLFRADRDGWLRTGDLGTVDDDGFLFLSGRRGDMIIRSGENVHPLEVEHVVASHPAVRDACVVGVPDRRVGEAIVAVLVAEDPELGVDEDDLRSHTRARLAGFKVPSRWVVVDELPRNPAGKVVRRQVTALIDV